MLAIYKIVCAAEFQMTVVCYQIILLQKKINAGKGITQVK